MIALNLMSKQHGGKDSEGGGSGDEGIGACSLGGGEVCPCLVAVVDTSLMAEEFVLVAGVETEGGLRRSAVHFEGQVWSGPTRRSGPYPSQS